MITVAIVDNIKLIHEWFLLSVRDHPGSLRAVAAAETVDELIAETDTVPDVVVLDVLMPGNPNLVENITKLRSWGAQVVILSEDDRSPGMRWLSVSPDLALAFVNKQEGFHELKAAIESAAAGEIYMSRSQARLLLTERPVLTERQEEVAVKVAAGMKNKEIAAALFVTEDAVREHVANIRKKYIEKRRDVTTRPKLIEALTEDGRGQRY